MTRQTVTGRTAAERNRMARLSDDLMDLQNGLYVGWLKNSLPVGWDKLEYEEPLAPHRTRVTLRVDDDVLRWYRKLGPGYQARINQVLRIYQRAVLTGQVETHYNAEVYARMVADARR